VNQIFDAAQRGWEGESKRLWEALHSHSHNVHVKNPDGSLTSEVRTLGPPGTGLGLPGTRSIGPTGSPKGTPAHWKSPPTVPGSMRTGAGIPMHNPLVGVRGGSLNVSPMNVGSPMLSCREPLARGSYFNYSRRGNP